MRRIEILVSSHLGIVTSVYRTGFLLPFRLREAYSGVRTRGEFSGTGAVADLFAVIASLITIAELIIFAVSGDGLPFPGLLIGIAIEVFVLTFCVVLPSVAVSEELRSRKIEFVFRDVFVCAIYAYVSYLIWRIIFVLVEILFSVAVKTPGAAQLLSLCVRIILFVGWFNVLADVLKKVEVVPAGERDLFYSFVGRFIFVCIVAFGTLALSFKMMSKILEAVFLRTSA